MEVSRLNILGINASRQTRWHAAGLATMVGAAACAEDLGERKPSPNPNEEVVAQFDPTNPIPVLTLVPTPTALVQDPATGDLDLEATAPETCEILEGPSTASCLPFAGSGGWPVNVPPTLLFSGPVVESSLTEGLTFVKLEFDATGQFMGTTAVPFVAVQRPRPAPPTACQEEFGYATSDIPPGVELILQPVDPGTGMPTVLDPGSTYVVVSDRDLVGAPLAMGSESRPIVPSSLFFLLVQNGSRVEMGPTGAQIVQDPPSVVQVEPGRFELAGPLLAQVEGGIRAANPDASEEEIEAAVNASAASLFGIRSLFLSAITPLLNTGDITDLDNLAFANVWSTQPAATPTERVVFDPAVEPLPAVPTPMNPIFTVETTDPADGSPDVRNAVPLDLPGIEGFNTLNGFSTVAPIAFGVSAELDPASLPGNVLMYRYDPTTLQPLNPDGSAPAAGTQPMMVPIVVENEGTDATIRPVFPLDEDAFYAVGVVGGAEGVRSAQGGLPYAPDSAFQLVAGFQEPLIQVDGTGMVTSINEGARLAVECSILSETGSFPPRSDPPNLQTDPVLQTLFGLEFEVQRPRFQETLAVFSNLAEPVSPASLAVAFSYKTQDINKLSNQIDDALLDQWEMLPGDGNPDVVPVPDFDFTGVQAQGFVCSALCAAGYFEPPVPNSNPIPRGDCPAPTDPEFAQLLGHPLCQINVSNITDVELYSVRSYDLLVGNPFVTGTFTSTSVAMPRVTRQLVWLIAGGPPGDQTPPTAGRPAAIFTHGLTVTKEVGLFMANTLAGISGEGGWAMLAMDLPFHGQRGSDLIDNATGAPCLPTTPGQMPIDPDDVTCTPDLTGSTCTGGCDDLRDPRGAGFVSANVFAVRDALRQTTVDHLTMIRRIRDGAFDGTGGGIRLDPNRIGYVGHSWGGITGANTMAITRDVERAVVNAAGGGLTNVLLTSTPELTGALFAQLIQLGVCEPLDPMNPAAGCEDTALFRLFLLLSQTAVDPGDPLAASIGVPSGLGNPNLMLQMIAPDGVINNQTTFALANGLGFVDLMTGMPNTDRFQIIPLPYREADPNRCHGSMANFTNLDGPNPNTDLCGEDAADAVCNTYEIQQQAMSWVATGTVVTGQVPAVVDALFDCQ